MSDFKSLATPLTGGQRETLWCLFKHGPTWDGNVPSKQGRDELVKMGFAIHKNRYAFLTEAGFDYALVAEMDVKKGHAHG